MLNEEDLSEENIASLLDKINLILLFVDLLLIHYIKI